MELTYKELFRIELNHKYYESGITTDFETYPTSLCSKTLRNYDSLFRKNKNGFIILFRADKNPQTTPLKKFDKNTRLVFILKSVNRHLLNFTKLPLENNSPSIYYLSNLNNNIQNSSLLLTSDTSLEFLTSKDKIELKPQQFLYTEVNSNPQVEITITDQKNNIIKTETISSIEGIVYYNVDLTNNQPGRYKMKVDDNEILDFYANDFLLRDNVFAVIEIFNNDDVPQAYKLTDINGNVTAQTYKINFEKRKTFWKYYVVLKYRNTITPESLTIEYPDVSNSFLRKPETIIAGGDKAIPFISSEEIALQSEFIKGIQLKKTDGGGGIFDINDLQNASVHHIVPDPSENKIYSEIFIYI